MSKGKYDGFDLGTDVDWRDVAVRAAKTFVQTFLATTTVGAFVGGDFTSVQAAFVAAASAAISVVWNAAAAWAAS